MSPLSKEEILAQLKNIGVDSTSEIDFYLKEYKKYTTIPDLQTFSPQAYHDEAVNKYPRHVLITNRLTRVYYSFVPRIVKTMNSIKAKASKRIKH